MFNLEELEQLVAFADEGTLSKAAEKLHISQPTITRTMKHLEEVFKVALFERSKNKIAFNKTGLLAVKKARAILTLSKDSIHDVQVFDQSLKTIYIDSIAPAPLWKLLPKLNHKYPSMTISSKILDNNETIISNIKSGKATLGIVTKRLDDTLNYQYLCKENLSVCLPQNHPLLNKNSEILSFTDINGYNFLLESELGFWDKLCRQKMPASRFLVQQDEFEFTELVKNSSLPFFTTQATNLSRYDLSNRVILPLSDSEAEANYYVVESKKNTSIK